MDILYSFSPSFVHQRRQISRFKSVKQIKWSHVHTSFWKQASFTNMWGKGTSRLFCGIRCFMFKVEKTRLMFEDPDSDSGVACFREGISTHLCKSLNIWSTRSKVSKSNMYIYIYIYIIYTNILQFPENRIRHTTGNLLAVFVRSWSKLHPLRSNSKSPPSTFWEWEAVAKPVDNDKMTKTSHKIRAFGFNLQISYVFLTFLIYIYIYIYISYNLPSLLHLFTITIDLVPPRAFQPPKGSCSSRGFSTSVTPGDFVRFSIFDIWISREQQHIW